MQPARFTGFFQLGLFDFGKALKRETSTKQMPAINIDFIDGIEKKTWFADLL